MHVTIRVKPASSRTKVGGLYPQPCGDPALIIAVTAPAVDGKATAGALKALAKALGVRNADVELVSGATSRTKIVTVPDHCRVRVGELMEA